MHFGMNLKVKSQSMVKKIGCISYLNFKLQIPCLDNFENNKKTHMCNRVTLESQKRKPSCAYVEWNVRKQKSTRNCIMSCCQLHCVKKISKTKLNVKERKILLMHLYVFDCVYRSLGARGKLTSYSCRC